MDASYPNSLGASSGKIIVWDPTPQNSTRSLPPSRCWEEEPQWLGTYCGQQQGYVLYTWQALWLSLYFRQGNWGSVQWRALAQVMDVLKGKTKIKHRRARPEAPTWLVIGWFSGQLGFVCFSAAQLDHLPGYWSARRENSEMSQSLWLLKALIYLSAG